MKASLKILTMDVKIEKRMPRLLILALPIYYYRCHEIIVDTFVCINSDVIY